MSSPTLTDSLARVLSGSRKYGLGLTLAHAELRQVAAQNMEVASAVLTNLYTRICFRPGDKDAKRLDNGFSHNFAVCPCCA